MAKTAKGFLGDKLSKKQLKALRDYEKSMETEAIPEIIKAVRRRAELAQKSRQWIIG